MPIYNIKCQECELNHSFSCSIKEFIEIKKNKFNIYSCKKCGNKDFSRVYSTVSSKVSRSSQEIVEKVRDEARLIVEKVKSGDQSAIRDVYGEGD
jgi:ribosomal protein L37AE/L43A